MVCQIPVVIYRVPEPYPPPPFTEEYGYDSEEEEEAWHTDLPEGLRSLIGPPPPGHEWELQGQDLLPRSPQEASRSKHFRVRARPLPPSPEETAQALAPEEEVLQGEPSYRIIARAGEQKRPYSGHISEPERHTEQTCLPDLIELDGLDFLLRRRNPFTSPSLPWGLYALSLVSPPSLTRKIHNDYKDQHWKVPDIRCTIGGRVIGTIRSTEGGSCYVLKMAGRNTSLVKSKSRAGEQIWRFFPTGIPGPPSEPWQWKRVGAEWQLKDSLRESGRQLAKFDYTSLEFEERCGLSNATREEILLSVISIIEFQAQEGKRVEMVAAKRRAREDSLAARTQNARVIEGFLVNSSNIGR